MAFSLPCFNHRQRQRPKNQKRLEKEKLPGHSPSSGNLLVEKSTSGIFFIDFEKIL